MAEDDLSFYCNICTGDNKYDWKSIKNLVRHQHYAHRDKIEEKCEYCDVFTCMHYKDMIEHHKQAHPRETARLLTQNRNLRTRSKPRATAFIREEEGTEDGIVSTAFNGACKYAR